MGAVWVVLIGWLALSLVVVIAWAIVRRGSSERSARLDDMGVDRAQRRSHRSEQSKDDAPTEPGHHQSGKEQTAS